MNLTGLLGALSLLLFLTGPALAYVRMAPPLPAFLLFAVGMLLGAFTALVGFVVLLRSGWSAPVGLALLGAAPTLTLVYVLVSSLKYPAINDVSTNVVYPPPFTHAKTLPANSGRDLRFPERFKDIVKEKYPELQPLPVLDSVDDVFVRAMDLAREQPGWEITSTVVGRDESLIEGQATTPLFGFVDDFVIRITKVEEGGCVVDMRSKSRDGQGDLGANARRIGAFLDELAPAS